MEKAELCRRDVDIVLFLVMWHDKLFEQWGSDIVRGDSGFMALLTVFMVWR